MSIIHYQLSISELRSLCHATPKINFYHLKNGYSAQVIRPKTTNPSDFTKCRQQRQWAHTHAQPSEVHRRMHRGTVSPLLKQSKPPKGAALRCWLKRINIRTSCLRSFSSCQHSYNHSSYFAWKYIAAIKYSFSPIIKCEFDLAKLIVGIDFHRDSYINCYKSSKNQSICKQWARII